MEHFIKTLKIVGQIIAMIISLLLIFSTSFLTETSISMSDKTLQRPVSISDFLLICVGIGLIMYLSKLFEKKEELTQK